MVKWFVEHNICQYSGEVFGAEGVQRAAKNEVKAVSTGTLGRDGCWEHAVRGGMANTNICYKFMINKFHLNFM